MPGQYETIKAQLTQDLAEALGEGATVVYGRLVKPKGAAKKVASVFTTESRQQVMRQVQETYSFLIALMVPLPATNDLVTDVEGDLMGYAKALTQKLTPFDTGSVQASAGPYAGVANQRKVTAIKPMEREDADQHVGVTLEFSCMATVFQ